jgi:hypothetical protein
VGALGIEPRLVQALNHFVRAEGIEPSDVPLRASGLQPAGLAIAPTLPKYMHIVAGVPRAQKMGVVAARFSFLQPLLVDFLAAVPPIPWS